MKKAGLCIFVVLILCSGLFAVQEAKPVKIETTDTTAVLRYSFDQPLNVQFFYGFDYINPEMSQMGVMARDEIEIVLDRLQPGSLYYYRANFYDEEMKRIYYTISSFRTTGEGRPLIRDVRIISDKYTAKIRIYCSKSLTGTVFAGKDAVKLVQTGKTNMVVQKDMGVKEPVYIHQAVLQGLLPNTSYDLSFEAIDIAGEQVKGSKTFVTHENNVALGKPVTGTFNNSFLADTFRLEGDILPRVTDGNIDYINGMAVSYPPEQAEQWVIVDLEKEYPISEVIVFWRSLAFPLLYEVGLSIDGKEWTTVKRVRGGSVDDTHVNRQPARVVRTGFEGQQARYVRVYLKKNAPYFKKFSSYNFVQMYELKVYPVEEGGQ